MSNVSKEKFLDKSKTRKQNALIASSLHHFLGNLKHAERMFQCSTCLDWLHCDEDKFTKLVWANFCRERMCPMCSARKAAKIGVELRQVAHHLHVAHPTYRYLVLTLTCVNVPASQLSATITRYFASWNRLLRRPRVKKVVKGWFRALEVTYSAKRNDYHPHIHALLYVPSNFFTKNYIKDADWLQLWREAFRDESITQVHIERLREKPKKSVKSLQGMTSKIFEQASPVDHVVGEVAKYACKPSSYLDESLSTEKQLEVFKTMSEALKGRRLYSFGLLLRDYHSQLESLNCDEHERNGTQPLDPCECDYCGDWMDAYTSRWSHTRYATQQLEKQHQVESPSERKRKKSDKIAADFETMADCFSHESPSEDSLVAAAKARITAAKPVIPFIFDPPDSSSE